MQAVWRPATARVCCAVPCLIIAGLNGCGSRSTQPAPSRPPQTLEHEIWHFRFIEAATRGRTDFDDPASEFGDLTVDPATLEFTYELWRHLATRNSPALLGTPMQTRPLLSVAAGFDGKNYWTARFERPVGDPIRRLRAPCWQAGVVTVFVLEGEEVDASGFQERFPSGGSFYMDAPLHGLLGQEKVGWDAESMRAILDHHPDVTRAAHHDERLSSLVKRSSLCKLADCSLYVKRGVLVDAPPAMSDDGNPWTGWSAVFAIDEREPCVRAVFAESPSWMGGWPYPTPESFFIMRDDQRDVKGLAGFEFGHQKYTDDETRIDLIEIGAAAAEED